MAGAIVPCRPSATMRDIPAAVLGRGHSDRDWTDISSGAATQRPLPSGRGRPAESSEQQRN
eukprot:2896584-Prymnesium_polylepis.1